MLSCLFFVHYVMLLNISLLFQKSFYICIYIYIQSVPPTIFWLFRYKECNIYIAPLSTNHIAYIFARWRWKGFNYPKETPKWV